MDELFEPLNPTAGVLLPITTSFESNVTDIRAKFVAVKFKDPPVHLLELRTKACPDEGAAPFDAVTLRAEVVETLRSLLEIRVVIPNEFV